MPEAKTFMVEDARLIFRNFTGKENLPFNRAGERNFGVILDAETAQRMDEDGWNIKFLPSREEGEPDIPFIPIKVNYNNRPPRVVMITSAGRRNLSEETVEVLDYVEIAKADLIGRAYDWTVGDKSGTKAYLQSLFVTIEEDALERKYAQVE